MNRLGGWAGRGGRASLLAAIDASGACCALALALQLRFDGAVPEVYARAVPAALALLVGSRLGINAAFRLYRWSFGSAGMYEALVVAAAQLLGSAAFLLLCSAALPAGLPRTVYALEFFLSATAASLARFGPRAARRWWDDWSRLRGGVPSALIVGVGPESELLARSLRRAPNPGFRVVGYVGDDPAAVGCRVDGARVLGLVRDLPRLIERHQVARVLLAERQPAARIREILGLCADSRAHFKIVPQWFPDGERRLTAAALHDLSPADLLPRRPVAFDDVEVRSRVKGRRALVTGAAGSIGSEICRQLVRHGARELVMVDMNENDLYLGLRRLSEEAHGTELRALVADVREARRLRQLGERHRPELVFHAAAHKHVPLMEDAPGEAVKNNVFGTLHVAQMAAACGAERFVLISTDKAVNPSSVMGATKRAAELVVSSIARTSRTRMTAVRFGNVLGSAGSVLPLFLQQIQRGGPVTITHPECERYFMTVPEAVGLVLVAGLGNYGDLCVLDMGEPIRILDLARNLITMAGLVPGVDVRIAFTGLRPGEKLQEQLLTDDEEETRSVRDGIYAVRGPQPPPDLRRKLADLHRRAWDGDPQEVLRSLQALVPTFRGGPVRPAAVVAPWKALEAEAAREQPA